MFENLKKKLNQFKESVNSKETELDEQELRAQNGTAVEETAAERAEAQQRETSKLASSLQTEEEGGIEQIQPERAVMPERPDSGAGKASSGSFFQREISERDLEEPLWELEMALLESDVAMSVTEEIVETVRTDLVGARRKWRQDVRGIIDEALRDGILKVLDVNSLDFDNFVEQAAKPVTVVFTGINGTGKTTTIAKVAHRLQSNGYSVVLAAGDTYRAGALEQIQLHAENLGAKLIKHHQGADPAAVIYDAVQYARARHKDVVLADTAGRIHTNINLMNQLRKIERVIDADLVIFVDEALAGNDAVQRALEFDAAMPIDGSILTKVDADSKGGTAISIAHTTQKPILFIGLGQGYEDIVKFEPQWLVNRLFDEAET